MDIYNLQLDKITEIIQSKNYTRILIQMPDGLLDQPLKKVIETLSSLEIEIFVSGNPSYGVCDLALDLALKLECDLIIHFGHSEFGFESVINKVRQKIDILLINAEYNINNYKYLSKLMSRLELLNWKNISLTATAQHLNNLEKIKKFIISKSKGKIQVLEEGQIIGCNIGRTIKKYQNKDGIVSIHVGEFHTKGLLFSTNLPILQVNPFDGKIKLFGEKERNIMINQRHAVITKARKAKTWGILASSKIGQYIPIQISLVKKILSEKFISNAIIISENINPDHLNNLNWIEAFVNTSCPRIATDDQIKYQKPILTYKEFLYLFNQITWENLLSTGFF